MRKRYDMRIVMANDTGAFALKETIRKHLENKGLEVLDLGTHAPDETMTYVEAGKVGAKAIQKGDVNCGILFCGSGAGVMITSNKHKGIRAVVSESAFTAEQARIINNANVLCMGANVVDKETALEMTDLFITTGFADGADKTKEERLNNYICEIDRIEKINFK